MGTLVVLLRRSLWLVLLTAVGGAAYTWWRDRDNANTAGPAEWPPLAPNDNGRASATVETTVRANASVGSAASSRPVADAPADNSSAGTPGWVEPADDGSCPLSHPIKANTKSGIFHVPDGRFYERTKAERCYTTADAAIADDYRQSKN